MIPPFPQPSRFAQPHLATTRSRTVGAPRLAAALAVALFTGLAACASDADPEAAERASSASTSATFVGCRPSPGECRASCPDRRFRFVDPDALAAWRARIGFVAASAPALGLQVPDDAALAAVLADACAGLTSFDELKKASLLDLLDASVAAHRGAIDRLAPRHVQLAGRRRAQVHYELDRPPWVASRLQDFLGLARGPAVADGRVPLVLHLLAPNQRPVQVTQDLAGFWVRHYPALRKELSRRCPRHAWPEDPTALMPE